MNHRTQPNVLITGTPGTGKSTLAEALAARCNLNVIEVGQWVKEYNLHDGYDEEFDAYLLNEDKVCDMMEDQMAKGGNIVAFHSCDFFPERWFDLVVVLRTDNEILYPRLEKRGYSQKKITENIECEIMQVLLDEARDSYAEDIVWELRSDTVEDMDANIDKVAAWIQNYRNTH